METTVLWLIILASALYVAWPYLRGEVSQSGRATSQEALIAEFQDRRDELLAALKDMELDREMGKISPEDYREISERYRREAVEVLRRIDILREESFRRKGRE